MRKTEFSWRSPEGLAIQAVDWEPEAEASAVVALVHGLGEHFRRYEGLAAALTDAGIAVLALDLPGHGRSEGKRGHAPYALVRGQIDRLLDEARSRHPGKPLFLYGHSLGGLFVLRHLIERRPSVTGAVVGSPGLGIMSRVPALKVFLAKIMARIAPAFTMPNGLDALAISRDPEEVRRYREDPLVHDRVSTALGLELLFTGAELEGRAGEIGLPLLLMHGTGDRLTDPRATERFAAAAGPKASFKAWEGWYHELHNEAERAQVFGYVIDWIHSHQ